jgi:hypothetical protein
MYLCYDNVVNIPSPRTKERKGLITYYETYGINTFFKHVDVNHSIIHYYKSMVFLLLTL